MKSTVRKHLILAFVLLVTVNAVSAQPIVIWTVDGDSITAKNVRLEENPTDSLIFYQKGKNRWISLDQKDIFSITYPNGESKILYAPLKEDDLSVSRMTMFIRGHSEGYKRKPYVAFAAGFSAGLLTMALPPDRLYFGPLFPISATIIVGKVTPIKAPNLGNDDMMEGYIQRRKRQNAKYAIYGGLSGLAIGSLASFAIYGWGWK